VTIWVVPSLIENVIAVPLVGLVRIYPLMPIGGIALFMLIAPLSPSQSPQL
jgi:hypothetical protein